MPISARHLFAPVALLTLAACSGNKICAQTTSANAGAPTAGSLPAPAPQSGAAATRAISEADIVQLDESQNRIYAMSKSGTLAIVDAPQPGTLTLLGKVAVAGVPFEMYRRGDVLLTMANRAVQADGTMVAALDEDATPSSAASTSPASGASGALIAAVDVRDPARAKTLATFKIAGEIADSRIVGNVLYVATYEDASCYRCGTNPRTLVTTFDISEPAAPRQVDQLTFDGAVTSGGFNAAWSTPWKRSIVATDKRLYVGGLSSNPSTTTEEGVIEVVDIGDPTGRLVRGTTITMAGPVMSRWQMDEHDGVLRVVSQRGAGRTQNGEAFPDIDTFRIESSASLVRIGHTTMKLPRQEGLKTVRFDGARAYAITFHQTDPLFTIDLADPTHPVQKGELEIPGWVFHLEPRGDRLVGLGLDRTDRSGNLNVSLFDVADLTKPTMIQRASFGPTDMYEDYMITNGVMAEDQDRIQKAFRVFDDGLIVVPFSSGNSDCRSVGGGVQLLDWTKSTLTPRGLVPMVGNPRRALRRETANVKELIAISDSNVSAFAIDQRDAPKRLADVVIGHCVARTTPNGMPVGGFNGGGYRYGHDYAPPLGGTCE